jgi:hypothetical protein
MSAVSCITVYFPLASSKTDIMIPQNSLVLQPFQAPLMFGTSKDAKRIVGIPCDEVIGTFVNRDGQFLSTVKDAFTIFTPKEPVSIGQTMFPHSSTHTVVCSGKSSLYDIKAGSVIVAHASRNGVKKGYAYSMFVKQCDPATYVRLQAFMLKSMNYVISVLIEIQTDPNGPVDNAKFEALPRPEIPADIDVERDQAKRARTDAVP